MTLMDFVGMTPGTPRKSADGYMCHCPGHEDSSASLSVKEIVAEDGHRKIILKDFAGCSFERIIGAMGLKPADLIVDPDPNWKPAGKRDGPRKGNGSQGKRNGATGNGSQGEGAGAGVYDAAIGATVHTVGNGAGNGCGGKGSGKSQGNSESPAGQGAAPTHQQIIAGRAQATARRMYDGPAGQDAAGTKGAGSGSSSGGKRKDGKGGGEKDEPKVDWMHPDAIYPYQDEQGKEVFQVVRLHYLNAKGKTFRQRRKEPGNPKAGPDGYVWGVSAEVRDVTLYRLPKVIEAIRTGKPVFVVEGEKDVATVERLGHVGTCNPGGANKWADGYTRRLAGADVIILPDHDTKENGFAGQQHAWAVAASVQQVAKRVRLLDLKEACPTLPPKGDISDMAEILGDAATNDALARLIKTAKDFDQGAPCFWWTPMEQIEALYAKVPGYAVEGGCIVQKNGETSKALTDFAVIPRQELTKDDGQTQETWFVLDGYNSLGRKLPQVSISGEALDNMSWVTRSWGFDANLAPGSTVKGKVVWAMKKVGQMTARKTIEYTHSGWREIDGKPCYLYQGGAVGAEGVTVNMGEALQNYRLDGNGSEAFASISEKEGAAVSWAVRNCMAPPIAVTLLGAMYLAPLREFLSRRDHGPGFALFLHGSTGTHKSTAAALALSHFGNFHAKNLPSNFHNTGNAIRKLAFILKDMPLVVDDFHPTESIQERRQMTTVAQNLSRAFGDGSDRIRLNADRSMQASNAPRSVAIITGETLPAVGASGLARFVIVDIRKGDIPINEYLTEMQEQARDGYLQKSMRGYIRWLIGQADTLPDFLHRRFLTLRDQVRQTSEGHDRAPEAIAHLLIGYEMMLRYFVSQGVLDRVEMVTESVAALKALREISRRQTEDAEENKPTRIFLNIVDELLQSGKVYLKDIRFADAKDPPPTVKRIGYMDREYFYLLPESTYTEVTEFCRRQGNEFPLGKHSFNKALIEDGIVASLGGPRRDKAYKGKRIPSWVPEAEKNATPQVYWIRRKLFESGEEQTEQMEMPLTGQVRVELPVQWTDEEK